MPFNPVTGQLIGMGAAALGSTMQPVTDVRDVLNNNMQRDFMTGYLRRGPDTLDVNDPRYYGTAKTDYGQDVAKENMDYYGVGGKFQTSLEEDTKRSKAYAFNNLLRLASDTTPGIATLAGGPAAQGLGGNVSNVIAKQQRASALGESRDRAYSTFSDFALKSDQNLTSAKLDSEKMRAGFGTALMTAQGRASDAENEMTRYNTSQYADLRKTNMASVQNYFSTGFNMMNAMNSRRDAINARTQDRADSFTNQGLNIWASSYANSGRDTTVPTGTSINDPEPNYYG